MKRSIYLVPMIFALVASACVGSPKAPEASQIARDIQTHGARSTVASLDRKGQFDAVLERIASGDSTWVNLARPLSQGTDAGESTGLTIALATALPRNPAAVLRVLDDGPVLGASAVCGVPFIEPEAGEVKAYLEQTIPAVERVAQTRDTPLRSSCLTSLGRARTQSEARP
jgi:ABC-type Fe3+-hydroxamate transport system substrate-binding protein